MGGAACPGCCCLKGTPALKRRAATTCDVTSGGQYAGRAHTKGRSAAPAPSSTASLEWGATQAQERRAVPNQVARRSSPKIAVREKLWGRRYKSRSGSDVDGRREWRRESCWGGASRPPRGEGTAACGSRDSAAGEGRRGTIMDCKGLGALGNKRQGISGARWDSGAHVAKGR